MLLFACRPVYYQGNDMTKKLDDAMREWANEMPPPPNSMNPNIAPMAQAMPDFRSQWHPLRPGKSGVEKMQKRIVKEKSNRALEILKAFLSE